MRLVYRLNIKELWDYCGYALRRNQYKTDYWNRMPIFLRVTSGYYIIGYVIFFAIMHIYNSLTGYPAAKPENLIYHLLFMLFWPVISYLFIRFSPRYLYFFLAIREGGLKEKEIILRDRAAQVEAKKGMLYIIYQMPCAQEEIIPVSERIFELERQREDFLRLLKREREAAEQQAITTLENPEVTVACNIGNEAAAEIMELSLFYQKQRKAENRLGNALQLFIWVLVGFSVPYFALLTGQFIWLLTWSAVVLLAREVTRPGRAEKRYLRDIQSGAIPELLGEWKMQCGKEGVLINHQRNIYFYTWKDIELLVDTDDFHVLCDKHGNMICALPKAVWKNESNRFDFRALCMNYGVKTKNAHTDTRSRGRKNAIARFLVYLLLAIFMSVIVFGPTLAMIPSLIETAEKVEEEQKWVQEEESIDAGPKENLVEEALDALDEQIKVLNELEIGVPKNIRENQETFIQMSSSAAEVILDKPYVDILCRMGQAEDYGDGPEFSDQIHWLDTQNDYYSGKNYGYVLEALEAMSGGKLKFEVLEETPYESIRFTFEGMEYEFIAEQVEIFDHQYLTMLNNLLEASGFEKNIYICREPENYFFQKGDLMFLREPGWDETFEAVTGFETEQP